MSKLRIVPYDINAPTVFLDFDETLVTYLHESVRRGAKRLGVPFPDGGVLTEYFWHWLRPDAEAFLQQLAGKGYQLFVMTRGWHVFQKKVAESLGISHHFLQILGRKHYDPRKLKYSTSKMPRPKYFVLVDDAPLAGDDEHRSIWKLRGLGLSLPIDYAKWTDEHKALADRHFIQCAGWEMSKPWEPQIDAPSLMLLLSEIETKLRKQMQSEEM